MSEFRRAMNIGRAGIGRLGDFFRGVEEDFDRVRAKIELENAREEVRPTPSEAEADDELTIKVERTITDPEERKAWARRMLGLAADAPFEEVRRAFERLNKRSDPNNFPEGSQERAQAAEIQKKVHWAYQVLTEGMDLTEKRFRSLEID